MRIDAYNAVSQIYQANSTAKAQSVKKSHSTSDKFEISSEAKTYQTAKSAVSEAPDVRADKVAQIKAQMEAGTYHISAAAVADKMLSQVTTLTF